MLMFPMPQQQQQQQPPQPSPHMVQPVPPPMPPPTYEDPDANQQAQARGYVYAYPPYAYPGQVCESTDSLSYVLKVLVDDAADDASSGPPGGLHAGTVYAAYAVSPGDAAQRSVWFVVHALTELQVLTAGPVAMYPPGMQMPPPQGYMQPPPHPGYPQPPNGAGPRQSMPATPIPPHAHPSYYHQSPQRE